MGQTLAHKTSCGSVSAPRADCYELAAADGDDSKFLCECRAEMGKKRGSNPETGRGESARSCTRSRLFEGI